MLPSTVTTTAFAKEHVYVNEHILKTRLIITVLHMWLPRHLIFYAGPENSRRPTLNFNVRLRDKTIYVSRTILFRIQQGALKRKPHIGL